MTTPHDAMIAAKSPIVFQLTRMCAVLPLSAKRHQARDLADGTLRPARLAETVPFPVETTLAPTLPRHHFIKRPNFCIRHIWTPQSKELTRETGMPGSIDSSGDNAGRSKDSPHIWRAVASASALSSVK